MCRWSGFIASDLPRDNALLPAGGRTLSRESSHFYSVLDLLLTIYGMLHFITLGHSCLLFCKYCVRTRCPLTSSTISDGFQVIYLRKIIAGERNAKGPKRTTLSENYILKVRQSRLLMSEIQSTIYVSQFLWFMSLETSRLFYDSFIPTSIQKIYK